MEIGVLGPIRSEPPGVVAMCAAAGEMIRSHPSPFIPPRRDGPGLRSATQRIRRFPEWVITWYTSCRRSENRIGGCGQGVESLNSGEALSRELMGLVPSDAYARELWERGKAQ